MVGSIIALLPSIAFLLVAAIFFFLMHDNPERLFFCLIYYFAFKSSTLFNFELVLNLEGINIFPEDLLTLFLALELIFSLANRLLSKRVSASRYRVLGKFYFSMSIIGLITWTYSEGIQTAVVNWRENLLSSVLILYCFSLNKWIKYELFSAALYRGSLFLSLLILIDILLNGVGTYSHVSAITGVTDRATTASGALFLVLALWNFLLQIKVFDFKRIMYVCVLATEILILQHRSVWIASIIGLIYLGLRLDNFNLRARILASLCIGTPFLFYIVKSTFTLSSAASDSGTLTWRLLRWQGSLGQSKSDLQIVFGGIIGHTESITVAGLNVAAHNMYVSLFEKFGLIGVFIYLAMLIPSRIESKGTSSFRNLDLVSSLTIVVFGVFYSFPYLAVLVLFSLRRIRSESAWKSDSALP